MNLPLIIHSRKAADDVATILREVLADSDIPVILHCFSGERILLDWGLNREKTFFSFAGNITYAKDLLPVLKAIPLEKLLTETDSPFLTPVPLRGKQNEPANIVHTVNFIAGYLGFDKKQFLEQLEENFKQIYGPLELIEI
jgi:TatD DNase family protein